MWRTLFSTAVELGRADFGSPHFRCGFKPAPWGGDLDDIHRGRGGCLPVDRGGGCLDCPETVLDGLVGRIAGGLGCFLSGDEHRGLVVFAGVRKKLGRLGPSLDHRVAGIPAHLDIPWPFPGFRPDLHLDVGGGSGVVEPSRGSSFCRPSFDPSFAARTLSGIPAADRGHLRHPRSVA